MLPVFVKGAMIFLMTGLKLWGHFCFLLFFVAIPYPVSPSLSKFSCLYKLWNNTLINICSQIYSIQLIPGELSKGQSCIFASLHKNSSVIAWYSMIGLQCTFPVLLFAICMSHIFISLPVCCSSCTLITFIPYLNLNLSLKVHVRSQMPLLLWWLPYILSSPLCLQELEGISLALKFHCILSELFL